MPDANPTRRRLLDAALDLLKEDGVQAVTHRQVEERAGVARGSTRYHFGSRDALMAALLGHVAELDHATLAAAAQALADGGLDALGPESQNVAIQHMTAAMLADPAQSLARFELYLYAARRPALADAMTRWRQSFLDLGAQHLASVGAAHPEAGARLLSASLDGLLLHALSSPHPDYAAHGPEWTGWLGFAAAHLGGPRPESMPLPEDGAPDA